MRFGGVANGGGTSAMASGGEWGRKTKQGLNVGGGASISTFITTAIVGTGIILVNHGDTLATGKLPEWWMMLVTYLLVCMTYMLGALWSKLSCPMCTRKLLGVPMNSLQPSSKTFSCSEMEEGQNSEMKDPLLEESELVFPSHDSVKAIHHGIPASAGNKSIFALTNDSSGHVAQHLEFEENRLTSHGSPLIVPLPYCGPVRSRSANVCDSARGENREKSAPLSQVSSARRTFHESASSFRSENFAQLLHPGYEEENNTGSAPKSNQCLISYTSDKTQASVGVGESIKEVSQPAVDETNSENQMKRLRRKSAPSKGHRDVRRQHLIRQKIARYRSESRRTKSMVEMSMDTDLHSPQEIYMYENALFMEDSLVVDNDISWVKQYRGRGQRCVKKGKM